MYSYAIQLYKPLLLTGFVLIAAANQMLERQALIILKGSRQLIRTRIIQARLRDRRRDEERQPTNRPIGGHKEE